MSIGLYNMTWVMSIAEALPVDVKKAFVNNTKELYRLMLDTGECLEAWVKNHEQLQHFKIPSDKVNIVLTQFLPSKWSGRQMLRI